MKADAPEKIYLQVCGDCPQTDCENCKFEDLEDNITWCKDRIFPKDIEYVRKDVFIERAYKFFKERLFFDDSWHVEGEDCMLDKVIKDFKKYIKGK